MLDNYISNVERFIELSRLLVKKNSELLVALRSGKPDDEVTAVKTELDLIYKELASLRKTKA